MGKRPKRKIVLFLVEGKSDREALQLALSELYERIDENVEVFFPIIHTDDKEERGGDITSGRYTDKRGRAHWVSPNNIEDAIYILFLEAFFDEMKILSKDITEVIQIVDLDGAYIPDEFLVFDPGLPEEKSPYYEETSIHCTDIKRMRYRNNQKSANLDYLRSIPSIKIKSKTTPYSVYFFSSNLDHFLHHDANLDYRQKRALADSFSRKYIGDVDGFVRSITEDQDALKNMDYDESWDYIKLEANSLTRHTNINILLDKLTTMAQT